jgi:glycosyltransferase involved in cell wall biosynthesis
LLDKPNRLIEPLGSYGRMIRVLTFRKIKFSPDVILTSYAFLIPLLKTLFPDVPIVYRMMGVPRTEFSEGIQKLAYAGETSIAKKYAGIVPTVTVSKYYSQLIRNEWKIDVPYVHNGVDIDFYKPPEDKTRVKNALGFMEHDYVVTLGLTRFNEVFKPLVYFEWYLDALQYHKEKRIITLILGKTKSGQNQLLKQAIDNYVARDRVLGHSFTIEYTTNTCLLREYYQASDLFISFMRQSLMEKEALACGVPVITECWEGENASKELSILQHGMVKKRFIEILDTFLQDENLRREYSKKGRLVAEKDFSHHIMVNKYREILHRAIMDKNSKNILPVPIRKLAS